MIIAAEETRAWRRNGMRSPAELDNLVESRVQGWVNDEPHYQDFLLEPTC